MHVTATSLAELLQQVLDGEAPIDAVLERDENFEGALAGCFHGLQHFAADMDIREKDAGFREMQEGEMRKLIALLRFGANRAALEKIHFLGVSSGRAFDAVER
ncbi:hypothetical protein QRD43_14665 [Pelomonas sp. APW6]|uniref:Uncharacterized protein n=1 Tax=Roseateles subflavus TaxID=3053353 RepID=A0ABT7LJW6_9BURK|nr:hypothetical protein [Pelomonas sp. APW6]MDL5033154.1 hypothetical protein [Pelomonas sp. APW6]